MKKLIIFLLLSLTLFASESDEKIRVQILEKILSGISIENEIKIWSDEKELLSAFKRYTNYKISENCENSTIIILSNKNNLNYNCKNKNIFVLKYNLLFDIPQSFGSLFWKKGRPNIVLINPRIKKKSIKISKNLEAFLEEKVW